jgi:hypothetical protein
MRTLDICLIGRGMAQIAAYGELEKRKKGDVSLKALAEATVRANAHDLLGNSIVI